MRLGILGPLQVVGDDGARLDPAAPRQRRLLLALLVWRDEPVTIDRLVDLVWTDGQLPQDPVRALRTYITRLRAVLDPDNVGGRSQILTAGSEHYTLHLNGHELDAERFEHDVARGVEALDVDPAQALRYFEQALARWRGSALMEVADEHWALPEVARLEELRVTALEHRFACLIDIGAHLEALSELERHVREHPLRERPHGLLMVALDRAGRTADAAEVFRTFRHRLADETGLDPSADLESLHGRLLTHSGSTTFAGTGVVGVWNRLPATRAGLIGRGREATALSDLLASHPVVTLTGVGGVGKTRLAIEVARSQRDAGGSVVFVELDRITDEEDVADAVFGALQLPGVARTDAVEGLVRVLRARECLLVLDNCEHVLDAAGALVDRLTRDCPDLTALTTSREPIGVDGERVYRLPSLDPDAGVALFEDRAAAAGALHEPGSDDPGPVRDICQRLDGIPLAIELAAARTSHMTVAEIAERVNERFWLLTGGRRALPRQQTLEAAIDWSYHLLNEEERLLLRAAAVFVDGFDVPALAAVAGRSVHVTLDRLGSLVNKSLVEMVASADRARYRLLETVRLYGLDRLKEAGELTVRRQRHAEHFLGAALAHEPRIGDLPPGGGERTMCRIRLDAIPGGGEADLANNFAALDWLARQGDLVGLGRLAARLGTVLEYRGFLDPERGYLARADVADALADPAERALYLIASALHAVSFGDFAEELRCGQAAMEVAADGATRAVAVALTAQASLGFDPERVPELVGLALRELPEDAHHARLLVRGQETLHLLMTGALAEAADRLEAHARAGDIFAAGEQMLVLHVLGEDERALEVPVPEGAGREHAGLWGYRWPLLRALASAAAGRPSEAARHLLSAAEHIGSSPVPLLDRDVLLGCAAAAAHRGDHERALHLLMVGGRKFRSPASLALRRLYRERIHHHVNERKQEVIAQATADLEPGYVLDQELAHLRTLLGASTA